MQDCNTDVHLPFIPTHPNKLAPSLFLSPAAKELRSSFSEIALIPQVAR